MRETYPPIQTLSAERACALAADPARRRLLDQIMTATAREQIDAAWQAHRAWLVANPDDIGVLEAGEDLAYAEETLTSRQTDTSDADASPDDSIALSSGRPRATPASG